MNGAESFGRTRHYPAAHARHAEARYVPPEHRQVVDDVVPADLRRVLQDAVGDPSFAVWGTGTAVDRYGRKIPRHLPWLGTYLSSGAYGMVYAARVTAEFRERVDELRKVAWHKVSGQGSLGSGAEAIVKVAIDVGQPGFELRNVREALVHRYLEAAPGVKLPGMREVRVSKHVPKLILSGMIRCVDPRNAKPKRAFVTVMTRAPGTTVRNALTSKALSSKTYVAIERALAALWVNGIAHNDLHMKNVLLDSSSGEATVIDFGFAAIMPPALADAVRRRVAAAVAHGVRSLGEVWNASSGARFGTDLQQYMNRVQYTRFPTVDGLPDTVLWYNPDGNALQQLFNEIPVAERTKVPAVRAAAWGLAARPTRFRFETARATGRPAANPPRNARLPKTRVLTRPQKPVSTTVSTTRTLSRAKTRRLVVELLGTDIAAFEFKYPWGKRHVVFDYSQAEDYSNLPEDQERARDHLVKHPQQILARLDGGAHARFYFGEHPRMSDFVWLRKEAGGGTGYVVSTSGADDWKWLYDEL